MITLSSTEKKTPIPPLLKVVHVAKFLSTSRHTVHELIDRGELKAADINPLNKHRRHRRVTRYSLLVFYKKRFGHSLNRDLINPLELF